MKSIVIKSYAKINLSIDVLAKRPDGYHQVLMVMQQIDLFDFVSIIWNPYSSQNLQDENSITLSSNLPYLPTDEKNIAYKAALFMLEKTSQKGLLEIKIQKNIPVAAGMAGGSSNCAAVMLALAELLELKMTLEELMEEGGKIGADVPFCIMGQATLNHHLKYHEKKLKEPEKTPLGTCAVASGIGEILKPIPGYCGWVLIAKPPISVSTAKVYGELKIDEIYNRPNTQELIQGLKEKNFYKIGKNMVNVLEIVSLKEYPIIMYTKNNLKQCAKGQNVLMSGSGPTVFTLFENKKKAKKGLAKLQKIENETYLVRCL